ncbi:MAG TPA: LysR substrate-binding domain-containing protein [Burkholderiaceae bacterium]|nr:LysR substrate-binding domain-containing protein [Burkholderiaceae bacterium]
MRGVPSVRQLRAFAAVYHSGQLSSAAAALSLTQPAVSVLLRELEERLGLRLFDRTTRTLHRTPAAEEAIGHAERVLAELDALGRRMGELSAGRRGRVRIAATSTIAQTLMPRAIGAYKARHPEVDVAIDDCAPGQFVETVLGGGVDFGVGTLQARVPGLDERVFVHDHLAVIADRELPLPGGPAGITWRQLAALPLITVKPGYGVRNSIDAAAAEAGVRLDLAYEVTLLTTALAMAASGLGPALLPASILAHAAESAGPGHRRLVARRLLRPTVARDIAVVTRAGRSLSPAAGAFAELLATDFASGRAAKRTAGGH